MKAEIFFILDRSGSMSPIWNDAVGGFDSFVEEQQKLPGEAVMSLAVFDHDYHVPLDRVPLQDVKKGMVADHPPRGSTALCDAIGRTIDGLGAKLDAAADKPDKVIIVILTDGQENASREYTQSRVAEMIKHQTEKYSWEFIYLAANQDAFAVGGGLNIRACNTANVLLNNGDNTRAAYATATASVASYRAQS